MINNTILITGGATGIGFALAQAMVAKGNTVLICARNQENLDAAKKRLPELLTYRCDVSDREQRRWMLSQIAADGYAVNVLVNNAAIMSNFDLANSDENTIQNIKRDIGVNLTAPIELIHELLPVLKSAPAASIINLNSPLGVVPAAKTPILCATKAGLHSYSRSLRHHLAQDHISIIDVFPPGVETPMTANVLSRKMAPERFVAQLLRQIKRGKNEIWIGESRALRILSRIAPNVAFHVMNKRMPVVSGSTG